MHLKKKISDAEIMKAFGITAETLVAIKRHKYDPIDGISLDNQSKIYKQFSSLQEQIESQMRGLNHLADIIFRFVDKKEKEEFKKSFKKPKRAKAIKKDKVNKNAEYDEYDECASSCAGDAENNELDDEE